MSRTSVDERLAESTGSTAWTPFRWWIGDRQTNNPWMMKNSEACPESLGGSLAGVNRIHTLTSLAGRLKNPGRLFATESHILLFPYARLFSVFFFLPRHRVTCFYTAQLRSWEKLKKTFQLLWKKMLSRRVRVYYWIPGLELFAAVVSANAGINTSFPEKCISHWLLRSWEF